MNNLVMHVHIRVQEKLSPTWRSWIGEVESIDDAEDGTSIIVQLPDQPALFGLLNQLYSLGLTVTGFERIKDE